MYGTNEHVTLDECCSVCVDGGTGSPCSEDCQRVVTATAARRELTRMRFALGVADGLLKVYIAEDKTLESPRVVAVMARIGEIRARMLDLRKLVREVGDV